LALPQRRELIQQLERTRGSRVICYVMGDRRAHPDGVPFFATQIGTEPQLLFVDALRQIGKTEKLDLFLYTRGGDTNAVWPLVSLLREYCDTLTVIVPFRAHSAGTLICLGAHEVILTSHGELSPIDPTTGNQFNPIDPANPQNRFGISVEDVSAYFTLAEKGAQLKEESARLEVFKQLTGNVHPLALGNVQRVTLQIRQLAKRLLALHMDEETDATRIEKIIKTLTEEFYSHVHAITRAEAIPLLGDWVRAPSAEEEAIIWDLFNSYAETLKLRETFNLPQEVGDSQTFDLKAIAGFIDTKEHSQVYTADMRVIQRANLPPNVQIQAAPGAALPLPAWATRLYDFDIQRIGWSSNGEEV
jgi:Serine dehydrogenase proteinase